MPTPLHDVFDALYHYHKVSQTLVLAHHEAVCPLQRLTDIRPGDLVAWLKTPPFQPMGRTISPELIHAVEDTEYAPE